MSVTGKSDGMLMSDVAKGDSAAFGEMVYRYNETLTLYATRIMGGQKARAEDIVQDCWITVAKKSYQFDTKKQFRPWILRVVRNKCISELRSVGMKRMDGIEDANISQVESKLNEAASDRSGWQPVEESIINNSDRNTIRRAIDSLKDVHRIALLAWLEEDDFVKTLSEELGLG